MAAKRYWLMKSEVGDYSIGDLERDGTTPWDGVRNYEARNLLRDEISPGDLVLYYHSNAKPSGVVGVANVVSEPYPDATQFDRSDSHYDPKSSPEKPRWWLVDVGFVERFPRIVSIAEVRDRPELASMVLLKKLRLSVQPVSESEFTLIRQMALEG